MKVFNRHEINKISCQDCNGLFDNYSLLNDKVICWECLCYRLTRVLKEKLYSSSEIIKLAETIKKETL